MNCPEYPKQIKEVRKKKDEVYSLLKLVGQKLKQLRKKTNKYRRQLGDIVKNKVDDMKI